jgi:hypothetical protein
MVKLMTVPLMWSSDASTTGIARSQRCGGALLLSRKLACASDVQRCVHHIWRPSERVVLMDTQEQR